jgi:hypothetical protein
MVERRRGLGFLDEASLGLLVVRQLGRRELEGDRPVQPRVLGAVHDAHPARTNRGNNLVRTHTRAWGERHRLGLWRRRADSSCAPFETREHRGHCRARE